MSNSKQLIAYFLMLIQLKLNNGEKIAIMSNNFSAEFSQKRIWINMFFSVLAFVLNLGISFFITPYITSSLGAEAYGFVKLANDFTSYVSLISIALNSMSSRFIMLRRGKGDFEGALKCYSSVLIANVVLAAVMTIPATICVINIDRMINIPAVMVSEVRITFAITFLNFLLNLAFSTLGNCYYLTNRLDISSVRSMQSNLIRVGAILCLYFFFSPKISYLVLGGLFSSIFVVISNFYYHKKLTPDLYFDLKSFDIRYIFEIVSSGIWNSITKLSQIFSSGLDLLVTNIFIGSTEMGYLSIAKTIPTMIVSFNSTIATAFNPNMMMLYTKDDIEALKTVAKQSMRFMCIFVSIPTAILITMGTEFFRLWVPEQPARVINILSVLTVVNSCVTGPMQPIYQIFTITNKVKQSSIVLIIYGITSIFATFICLKYTNLGVYAVAGVSLVGSLIVALCYHAPFAALYLGLPWNTFFPEIMKSILSLGILTMIGFVVNFVMPIENWLQWFGAAFLTAGIGICVDMCLILDRGERKLLLKKVKSKLHRN